jgi:ribosomal-protein-alanine N-acetyltransferase
MRSVTTIRTARENEAVLLADIGLAAWDDAIVSVAGLPADKRAMQEVAHFAFLGFARSLWHRIRVVELDGGVVGWAACERPDGTITDFWILPEFQRRGLGTRLMDALEAEIVKGGLQAAEAATHVDNAPAVAFFSKRGYRIAWLSTRYAARLDRDVEQVGLRKPLIAEDDGKDGFYQASWTAF